MAAIACSQVRQLSHLIFVGRRTWRTYRTVLRDVERAAADGLDVIGVLHDSASVKEVEQFAEAMSITYTLMRAHKGIANKWAGLGVLPTTFLVDQQGTILRKYVGATAEQVVGLVHDIEAAMAGRPLGPIIIPETPAVSTDEDRLKLNKRKVIK